MAKKKVKVNFVEFKANKKSLKLTKKNEPIPNECFESIFRFQVSEVQNGLKNSEEAIKQQQRETSIFKLRCLSCNQNLIDSSNLIEHAE